MINHLLLFLRGQCSWHRDTLATRYRDMCPRDTLATYLVLFPPNDLRWNLDLVHVLMEGVSRLLTDDFQKHFAEKENKMSTRWAVPAGIWTLLSLGTAMESGCHLLSLDAPDNGQGLRNVKYRSQLPIKLHWSQMPSLNTATYAFGRSCYEEDGHQQGLAGSTEKGAMVRRQEIVFPQAPRGSGTVKEMKSSNVRHCQGFRAHSSKFPPWSKHCNWK